MNIHQLKEEIEKKGSVTIPRTFASTVMQECENHRVEADWTFRISGNQCHISRPTKQGEDHPLTTNR